MPSRCGQSLFEQRPGFSDDVPEGIRLPAGRFVVPLDRMLVGSPSGSGLSSSTVLNLGSLQFGSQQVFGNGLVSSTLGHGLSSSQFSAVYGRGLASSLFIGSTGIQMGETWARGEGNEDASEPDLDELAEMLEDAGDDDPYAP